MSRKLSNDVSIQELLRMREDGMSNAEIAEQLDVHVSTIYNYIGKQPAGMRRPHPSKRSVDVLPPAILFGELELEPEVEEPESKPEVEVETPFEKSELRVVSRITHLESFSARYMISNGVVKITSKDMDMPVITFSKEELDGVVAELLEVLDMM